MTPTGASNPSSHTYAKGQSITHAVGQVTRTMGNRKMRDDGFKPSEMLALCIVLEMHPGASYTRPVCGHGQRTPDWMVHLPDGRDIAIEVTAKRTDWRYETWSIRDKGIRVGWREKGWKSGASADFSRTLEHKMKDKAERGQLQAVPADGRWLCIQLDDDARSETETFFEPVPRIILNATTGETIDAYSVAAMPDFEDVTEGAAGFGYGEVWAIVPQSLRGEGNAMILRLDVSQQQWNCFHTLGRWRFEDGGIAQQWRDWGPQRHVA